jgi:hypothetical protein
VFVREDGVHGSRTAVRLLPSVTPSGVQR